LFAIAPFHHRLEHRGEQETTIVMKAWLVQWLLAAAALILFVYQLVG
jgi:UDP-N-acetylmuramyl pentapeptide phosphotransferase/UDP-N-acetylglucosamine-1-phosphate transferase